LVEDAVVAKEVVEVALVVVLFARFGRKNSVPRVSVALMRASARAGVKYRFEPSRTLVVRSPRDEVASCWYPPPVYAPRRMPATDGEEIPVPPPAAVRTPAMVLVKVMVLPDAVMVVDAVSPWYAVDEVANVIAGPTWSAPTGPMEVTAERRPWVRQVPPCAKQPPLVRLIPEANVDVAPAP